ncbi:MAG: TIGR03790 family protein [Leptothrix sp. (in: b-proteobacteria)]
MSRLADLCWLLLACLIGVGCTAQQSVQAAASGVPTRAAASMALRPQWIQVPRTIGRITAAQLGVVINTTDPYSVAVGEYYVQRRRIAPEHVLRLALPRHARLSVAELENLRRRIDEFFGDRVEALALAWVQPFAVECQSITGALTLGFDPDLCSHTCARSNLSRYHNAMTERPWTDLGLRPSMLLAARTVEQARAMIDRGIAADYSLGLRGALPAQVYFLATSDAARSVRERVFPPAGLQPRQGIDVHVERTNAFRRHDRLLLVETGLARLTDLDTLGWLPGALADHLTSFGGVLDQTGGQTTALAWIESGATASYGTVSEPCNHLEKFPHPQKLLLHYVQGSSALEAYWKSVAWPQQGVFVGEPLAAPFARRVPSSP